MRRRPWLWLCVSLICFFAAAYFWRLGDKWAAQKAAVPAGQKTNEDKPLAQPTRPATQSMLVPMRLLSEPGNVNFPPWVAAGKTNSSKPNISYRVSNNPSKTASEFARSDHSILLENALIDTSVRGSLPIPESLKAKGDPGSYIVQSRGPTDARFRSALKDAGAAVVAYIPNNAYLVRASEAMARKLEADSQTQTVLPYEPYYKLTPSLLKIVMQQESLPRGAFLNVLVFEDARESVLSALNNSGMHVAGQENSPFGPIVKVQTGAEQVQALAAMPGVQSIELSHQRHLANDLSRVALGVAADSVTTTNYLNLSGSNVIVAVSDTGVDTNHPDLLGRVTYDIPISGVDSNGHGTHVAGIIGGDGSKSTTVTNAQGSVMPGTNGQYRGKAPAAKLFSMEFTAPDSYLQETAAKTNALISNNSWTYESPGYDLAAASFDAAVRDSLPMVTGPQSITYVFPTGNGGSANVAGGGANQGGTGGDADTILSPGTAKNVITVGAVEQLRNITNEVSICFPDSTSTNGFFCETNIPWSGSTDSSNQVASFSGRGNVGISFEGEFGRFKPDVVAPGTFVVSTRSGQWDTRAYYDNIDYSIQPYLGVRIPFVQSLFLPANATQLGVRVLFSDSRSPLIVYVTSPSGTTYSATNQIFVPPTGTLSPLEDWWLFAVSNTGPETVTATLQSIVVLTNAFGDFFQVLSNMNNDLGPYYRYESGSSMAAAEVSGTLALMHQFFQENLHVTNSPALMKALLINGARSLGNAYNFQVHNTINYQGWGQPQLPNSIPAGITNFAATGKTPLYFVDQNPTNALATGESHTRNFRVSDEALGEDLRVTVAWTDPPGNPVAGIKLVNDLDLVVTNKDTGDVYFGNDIRSGKDYNQAWDVTNELANVDFINNVENVYLHTPGCTNFSVTVIGHRVNVNAVSGHPDNVVQDYALVVSSGNGAVSNALSLTSEIKPPLVTLPNVTWVTNDLPADPENPVSGGLLLHQRVGANTPLLGTNTLPLTNSANAVMTTGMTNQWKFYVLSNDFNFTNASFITFLPPEISIPRMGVNSGSLDNATRVEADIDMYVSTEPGLTNLDPGVLLRADKSLSRGGTEFIVYSNAARASVYYVGIKAEDQMAAEFEFLGVFSLLPPTTTDADGNRYLRGMPLPSFIPSGTPLNPQAATVLALDFMPVTVRRVIVTNTWNHTLPFGVLGNLSHNRKFAVLNSHTCAEDRNGNCVTNSHEYVYEDNGERNVPFSRNSDGPGNLKEFIGEEGLGVWLLTMVNNLPGSTGAVNRLMIKLEPQNLDTNGTIRTVLPDTFTYDSIDVPSDATNLTVCVSGNTEPMELYVMRDAVPTATSYDYHLTINPPGDCLPITIFDTPPLVAGRYYIGVYNPAANNVQTIRIVATIFRNPYAVPSSIANFAGPVAITDDAVTYAYITNLMHLTISALDVGLLIHHPRISDLAITLISPNGTRVLLFEDRGGVSTNGVGTFSSVTNEFGTPMFLVTNMVPFYTNNFDDVATGWYAPGAVFDGWSVLTNYAQVYPLMPAPWLSNNVMVLGNSVVSNTLPTTNSTAYALTFKVTHAPYLNGTVAWWPLDEDGRDIFGGFDGLLSGDVLFNSTTGMVNQAFFGDGVATRMMVPRCPDIDVGQRGGFTIEGWIRPHGYAIDRTFAPGALVTANGFEDAGIARTGIPAGSTVSGWLVESGDVDLLSRGFEVLPDTGQYCLDLNGFGPGTISRSFPTVPGSNYILSFAYTKCPSPQMFGYPDFVALADLTLTGQQLISLKYTNRNSFSAPNWAHTSIVFTASSAVTTARFASGNWGNGGMYLDSFSLNDAVPLPPAAPVMEWCDGNGILSAAKGAAVALQQPTATWSQTASGDFSVARTIDNVVNDNLGWGIQFGITNQTAAWETTRDINNPGGTRLTFKFLQYAQYRAPDLLGRFRLSVTSDDRSTFCDGLSRNGDVTANWYYLRPSSAISSNGVTLSTLGDDSILASGLLPWNDVYTVSAVTPLNPITGIRLETLTDPSLPYNGPGREPLNGNFVLSEFQVDAAPVINPTNQGVQLWLGDLTPSAATNGVLSAIIWDTNSQPHYIATGNNAITNDGWQHVALTFDAVSRVAKLYTNGTLAVAQVVSPTNFVPRTSSDLYLGYHPGTPADAVAFSGGLDEFGLYSRPLWSNEIAAIFDAGVRGKYGTNVLRCPVTNSVQLVTSVGATTYTFTNGFSWWTNGPQWETNVIYFTNLLTAEWTNGPATNFTGILITNTDFNAAFDDFVLWSLQTNSVDGLMHFTENTNLARVPIKFGPLPYTISNLPPTLVFSNEFEMATQGVYQVGATLRGGTNDPAFGPRDWTVVGGPVTVVSNTLVDAVGSNAVALAGGGLQCTLPTIPGHRYEIGYSLRGPGAVSWWTGDIEPLSQRAWDVIGGNQGAFVHDATNSTAGYVNALGRHNALFLPGKIDPTNGYASKIEVADPANLRLTNGFTIDAWVRPNTSTNLGTEQILFRGDSRSCADPYYLALQRVTPSRLDIVFHIENSGARDCGVTLATVHQPVIADRWQHIAAVFEPNVILTNAQRWPTNQLRIYYNGVWLRPQDQDVALSDSLSSTPWNDLTGRFPFADLDPGFSPGVAIGNRSRLENSEPYKGYIDELTVYGRTLSGPEVAAIYAAGAAGKGDYRAQPEFSLAKLAVLLDGSPVDVANGANSRWTSHSFVFTADRTNLVVTLQSLLPGTIVDGVTLTELPAEMNYLPEESLAALNGEDAYGIWRLEIWDTRAGGFLTNDTPSLLQWQLNFVLPPSNPPPAITLSHGIPYTNTLTAYGIQALTVDVPQWATNATNVLLFAADRTLTNPAVVGVLWDQTNQLPLSVTNALFWPPVTAGVTNLTTNTAALPYITQGQPYYITVTNPNPYSVTYAYGVWFDIVSLTNCQPLTNFVAQAGIPRYFQFDVPTNALAPDKPVTQAFLYLTGLGTNYVGFRSNVTVVVSEHLPLPDLTHYDYMSRLPSTNDDIVMVLTNSTPFPIQDARWYVGVFGSASTNVPFVIQSCYTTSNYPVIVHLTNAVPFSADLTNAFAARPGPPRSFFFELEITNYVDSVLFELYGLSGDADLVVQREIPPTMAPYFDGSFSVGRTNEQVVVRAGYDLPDLRGKWYLGIFNTESTNVSYSIRALEAVGTDLLTNAYGMTVIGPVPMSPPHGFLLQWNSVIGEYYEIDSRPSQTSPWTPLFNGFVKATTPLTTFEVSSSTNLYQVVQVSRFNVPPAPLRIQLWTNNFVRLSWSTAFPGQTLQSAINPWGPWVLVNQPVTVEGNEFVVYDLIGTQPKYYRLMP